MTLFILATASIGLVLGIGAWARASFRRQRQRLDDADLVKLFEGRGGSSNSVKLDVLRTIAEAYGIEHGTLRPSDAVSALAKIDSWRLDAGAERVEKAFASQYYVELPRDAARLTIGDLVSLVK